MDTRHQDLSLWEQIQQTVPEHRLVCNGGGWRDVRAAGSSPYRPHRLGLFHLVEDEVRAEPSRRRGLDLREPTDHARLEA